MAQGASPRGEEAEIERASRRGSLHLYDRGLDALSGLMLRCDVCRRGGARAVV